MNTRKTNQCKREILFKILTPKHCSPRPPYFSKALKKSETIANRRWRRANVVGLGFGVKEKESKFTGDVAIRVYVRKKIIPKNKVPRGYRIPDSVCGLPTDVIQVGRLKFHLRPVPFGTSISHTQGGNGSLGCIVSRPGTNAWYMLSASHVLAPPWKAAASGDNILEPPGSVTGSSPIARLTDFEPLKTDGVRNHMDAAIAELLNKSDVILRMPRIGQVRAQPGQILLYQSVRKYGAGTFHSLGIVTDVAADVAFFFNGEEYLFQDVVQVTGCGSVFSDGGDSGALVVDALTNSPIGIIIGGAGDRSYITPIDRVLKRFNTVITS